MSFWCKFCEAYRGLEESEIESLPQAEEEEARHLEREHHIPVRRNDETLEECVKRFRLENPDAGGPNCKCPLCTNFRKLKAGVH